jgi:hypothetical protein
MATHGHSRPDEESTTLRLVLYRSERCHRLRLIASASATSSGRSAPAAHRFDGARQRARCSSPHDYRFP